MAKGHLTEAQKTIHSMDREAGIQLNRISLIARLAECTLTPNRWSEVEEALQLIKTLSDDLANQLNCMAEMAGAAWSESDYAGL
jgi:hypothetical protein